MTLLRIGDVISIQLGGYFHAAYMLGLHRDMGGTLPAIEFYEGRYDHLPTAEDLAGRATARGSTAADGLASWALPTSRTANRLVALQQTARTTTRRTAQTPRG